MNIKFKQGLFGYFKFFYSVLTYKLPLSIGLGILVSALDAMGLAMFMPLLQIVTHEQTGAAGDDLLGNFRYLVDGLMYAGFELTIYTVLGTMVFFFGLKGLLSFILSVYQVKLRQLFIRKIRYSLADNLSQQSYESFLALNAGKIQNTLTGEVTRLLAGMNQYLNSIQGATMLFTYIVLAFIANWQFAVLVGVGAFISNFLFQKIYKKVKQASAEISKKGNEFNAYLIQAIHHFKYLKATNYFSDFIRKIKAVILDTEKINYRIGYYQAFTKSIREPVIVFIIASVIIFQINVIGSSMGTILLSLLLFYRALSNLVIVQTSWQTFVQNVGSMQSIVTLSSHMYAYREIRPVRVYPGLNNTIVLKDVSFGYGEKVILKGINFELPKNKTVAIVGKSGSGKTTLANLVSGLVKPKSGSVVIDGIDREAYDINSYRDKVGYVSQEPVIFNDTIYNNITFWAERSAGNLKRFKEVLDMAYLSEYVESLSSKEDSPLGDNGLMVSGGQKQRISIARELYKNAELLIFDEATSSLDSETERVIQMNIEMLHGKYTIVIIAHRLSTIKAADVIYMMEGGRIVDVGSFDELMVKSPGFQHMVHLQEFN